MLLRPKPSNPCQYLLKLLRILPFSLTIFTLAILLLPNSVRAMEHLVLKVGNSHLVAAFFKNDIIVSKIRLAYEDSWFIDLKNFIDKHPSIETVFIGSVNSKVDKEIHFAIQAIPKQFRPSLDNLSIGFSVDNPNEVGSDIIANCYGALKLYPNQDIVVIDMGTAITISAIDKDRNFLGVSILPGIEMSARGLNIMTDQLPTVDLNKPPKALGKNTVHCIQSGLYFGLLGSIKYITSLITEECFPSSALVVATGGLTAPPNDLSGFICKNQIATFIQKDIQKQIPDILFAHDLTLIGMYEILKEQLH